MKSVILAVTVLLLSTLGYGQRSNPDYDSALAKKYGADDYGMKRYVLVILKTGSHTTTDQALIDSCFAGHMNNMDRLVKEKKLIVAGPLGNNENSYRGIFILDVATIKEAEELVQTDPAVRAKLLAAGLYEWYGSAALPAYLDESERVWKKGE